MTTEKKKPTFGKTAHPLVGKGWDLRAFVPGRPGLKIPGRWIEDRGTWVNMKATGLLREGLAVTDVTWEDVQDWPTGTVCVLGRFYPAVDVDVENAAACEAVRAVLVPTLERGRPGSLRFLVPYIGASPIASWKAIQFTMPGSTTVHQVELNGDGKQWLAFGRHRDGGSYVWSDAAGPLAVGTAPDRAALPIMTQDDADRLRVALVDALRPLRVTFLNGSDKPQRATAAGEEVDPDLLDPVLTEELLAEMVAEVVKKGAWNRETTGGYLGALSLLASMRACLGRDGSVIPECVLDLCAQYDGDPDGMAWAEAKWGSFDTVRSGKGPLLQWAQKYAPDVYPRLQAHVDAIERRTVIESFPIEEGDDGEPPNRGSSRSAGGAPAPNARGAPNTLTILRHLLDAPQWRGVLGFCEFRQRVVLNRPIPRLDGKVENSFRERPLEDQDFVAALLWLNGNGLPRAEKGKVTDAVLTLANECRFHPVQDYLGGLVWDGTPRLDTWLEKYVSADTNDRAGTKEGSRRRYLAAIGRRYLVSAVARGMRPGCKVDTVLVLEGKTGHGKSSAFARLMPREEWFSDNLPHDVAHRDTKAHLQGKWIVEMPELAQFNRSEVEAMKAFITAQGDEYRPAYGRCEVHHPRQCVFGATTNQTEYLKDDTGNRRFWPVRVTKAVDLAGLERDRDQLWAEAVVAYRAGEPWWLDTPELRALAEGEQGERQVSDPWDHDVMQAVAKLEGSKKLVTTAAILEGLGKLKADRTRQDDMRVTGVLKRFGYSVSRKRVGGILQNVWSPGAGQAETASGQTEAASGQGQAPDDELHGAVPTGG